MPFQSSLLYIGIKGHALAVDRSNGRTVWESPLKGGDFVNVVMQGGDLYAATKGRLYRLDPATGKVLWMNELPGYGYGIVSIAGASPQVATAAERKRRSDQAAASGATSAST